MLLERTLSSMHHAHDQVRLQDMRQVWFSFLLMVVGEVQLCT